MIVSTTEGIPGREIEAVLGIAQGNVVRAKHIGKDFMASLKGVVGGEIEEYSSLMAEARDQALDRLIREAERLGADAVVNLRFATSMISQGMSEILAYGTAVKTGKDPEESRA